MPALLTKSLFQPVVNQTFRISSEPELQLVECEALKSYPGAHNTEPFRLIFRGPMTPLLSQRIYTLENDSLGEVDIFLVPIGPRSGGMEYEAIFN